MSMELWVFSDKKLRSVAEWQDAIDAERYPLRVSAETPFERLEGFVPCDLRGELTGFECYHDQAAETMRDLSDVDFGHDWKYVLAFRWAGSKMSESVAAWMAGAAYARATDGVVYNDQDSARRSADECREVVRGLEQPFGREAGD